MQKVIEKLDSDKIFVLGTVTTNKEIDQKYKWLEENYTNIKRENIILICSTTVSYTHLIHETDATIITSLVSNKDAVAE